MTCKSLNLGNDATNQQTAKQLGKFNRDSTDSSLNQIFTMFAQIKIVGQGLQVVTAISLIILSASFPILHC